MAGVECQQFVVRKGGERSGGNGEVPEDLADLSVWNQEEYRPYAVSAGG
ncbi:MAG: hypothetical protein ACKPHU_08265 [Planctomycetaceae bacterium]